MKPYPHSGEDDGGGLDSLLDTMTNVLGILVLVLIATQLGVRDAVTRIADSGVIDPAMVEAARERLMLLRSQRDALQAELDKLMATDDNTLKIQLANLRRQLEDTQARLEREDAIANQFAKKIESDTKMAEEAKKRLQEMTDDKETLQAELNEALDLEAKLKAMLDETPVLQAPPPKVVTLPDPRAAPEDARPVTFLCMHNRVFPIAADDLRDTIRKRAEFIVKDRRLDGGPAEGVDEERFMKLFNERYPRLGDDFFDVELYAAGRHPRLRFTPRTDGGVTVEEILKTRSRFHRMVYVLDKSKYYGRFIVLPDSFEVYAVARAVADQMGMLSGWDPEPEGWGYTTALGGSIRFGPPPPPDPDAKPAPPPKPAKPAKPAKVID